MATKVHSLERRLILWQMLCRPDVWFAVGRILLHERLICGGCIHERVGIVRAFVSVWLSICHPLNPMAPAKAVHASRVSIQVLDLVRQGLHALRDVVNKVCPDSWRMSMLC